MGDFKVYLCFAGSGVSYLGSKASGLNSTSGRKGGVCAGDFIGSLASLHAVTMGMNADNP